jgi:uncharacterized membrane protein YedE/YeeE
MVVAFFVIYATQPFAADYIAVIAGFVLLFGGMALASVLWAGARHRPWFWLVSVLPGILALLVNAFYGPYGLTHPSDTLTFVTTVLALAGGILLGFGSRWAGGCTSGHGIGGNIQLSIASMLASAGFFIGGILVALALFGIPWDRGVWALLGGAP